MATLNNVRTVKKARRPGRGPLPFVLAVVVHLGLFAFLFTGVRWQKTPPIAQAELWLPSVVMENAAPGTHPRAAATRASPSAGTRAAAHASDATPAPTPTGAADSPTATATPAATRT